MEQINPYILIAGGSIISLLLMIVGYFLSRLVKSTDILAGIVKRLEIIVEGQRTTCFEKHLSLNNMLTVIEGKFAEINRRLIELEKHINKE